MDYANIGVPQFDDQKYDFWSIHMKTYVQEQRFDVWRVVVDGNKAPTTPPTYKDGKKLEDNDSRVKNVILNGLNESIYTNIMHCESAK
jgi:hypothetical protein